MFKSLVAHIRPKTALALLLVVLTASTGVVIYRAYRSRQENAAKLAVENHKALLAQTLREDRESLRFIENKGQWPSEVLFGLQTATGAVWIRKDDVLFRAAKKGEHEEEEESEHKEGHAEATKAHDEKAEKSESELGEKKESEEEEEEEEHEAAQAHAWKMSLVGMNPNYKVKTGESQPTAYSYFQKEGSIATNVPSFKEITLEGIYPGIDVRFYTGVERQIEYDFIVAPGADYRKIKVDYEGLDSLKVAEDRSLELGLRFGTVKTHIPEAYQLRDGKKQIVDMSFKVAGNQASFEPTTPVDPTLPLVIDPTLLWGTYFDNNTNTFDAYCYASKANACGEVYAAGFVDEAIGGGYTPATGFNNSYTATYNAIVYRFNAGGTAVLNLTYFGGAGSDEHTTTFIDLDLFPDGRVIAVGRTEGTIPFPFVGITPYQSTKGGGATANLVQGMVAVFSANLTTLHYASYLGGGTTANNVDNNAVRSVVTLDNSTYFLGGVMTGTPVVGTFANGPDTTIAGSEGYVARFTGANYNTKSWATFVGGDNTDNVFAVKLTDDLSKVVFSGDTTGGTGGFPTLVNPVDNAKGGTEEFVGYLDSAAAVPSGFGLLSYVGGSGDENRPVLVADNTNIFLLGTTFSTDIPGAVNSRVASSAGTLQVETSTLDLSGGSEVMTLGGNVNVTVTAAGLTGSPLLIQVAVLTGDSENTVASKIRSALNGNGNITAKFTVGGSNNVITLTQNAPAIANDGTLAINIADAPPTNGVNEGNTNPSSNTTAGVAATYTSSDIFVSKIPLTGGIGNIVTRYLGGSDEDRAGGIILTTQNDVLIFGSSEDAATDYPTQNTTPGTTFFDGSHNGSRDIVWTYLPYSLGTPVFSTFIGGSRDDYLGDTGVLAGSGHLGYNATTGVITLGTTTHSTLPSTIITAGAFDTTVQNGSNTKDNHVILKFAAEVNDFGDAPLTYDGAVATAARHGVTDVAGNSFARLGLLVDVDPTVQSSALDDADDLNSTVTPCLASGDDEDGVTLVSGLPLSISACGTFPFTFTARVNAFKNTSPNAAANIYAWVDVNNDGIFDVSERRTGTLAAGTNNVQTNIDLSWSISSSQAAAVSGFHSRFRITTETLPADASGLDDQSRGPALNGEVEDHYIPVIRRDYGDAPNSYLTSLASGGPSHIVTSGLYIGSNNTDAECDSAGVALATIDDTTATDDETFLGSLSIATTATSVNLTVPVGNTTSNAGQLCGWIDFNSNGVFDATEGRCVAVSASFTGNVALSWAGLGGLVAGQSYLRLRIGTDGSLTTSTWAGAQGPGEVEDHPVTISSVTAVDLASFKAYQVGDSVFLDWKTGFESNNLGFNIYREAAGTRIPVTPSLIAGSGLMVGQNVRLEAGLAYSWRDDVGVDASGAQYWLEDVDLNGATKMHGPFGVTPGESLSLEKRRALATQPRALKMSELSDRLNPLGASHELQPQAKLVFPSAVAGPPGADDSRLIVRGRIVDVSQQSAVKIGVKAAGWYRVTQADLVTAGLDAGADPRNLQLYVDGKQVPIRVTGEEDGRFDSGDAVEFYGVGLDVPSTDTRVYWLMASRLRGQRVPSSGAGGGGSPPPSFTHTVERKDRVVYIPSVMNGEADNFFGMPLAASIPTVTQALTTPNLYTDGDGAATLDVALQGVSDHQHSIKITLNGVVLGSINFSGQERGAKTFQVAQSQLVAGDNLVKLDRESAEADVTVIESLKLTYQHAWKADSNALLVKAQGGQQLAIGGFTNQNVRVVDITDIDSPSELTGEVTQQTGTFTITVSSEKPGARKLYAFSSDVVRTSVALVANQLSALKAKTNKADLVIIAHSSVLPGVAPLADLRRRQGLNVAIVDVADIYDEFSFGNKTTEAIADFIRYAATSWAVKAKAILFVGKATYDPRYYTGQGDVDLVPTHMVGTETMECPVDDSLADFNGDGIPELAVGRLPVRNLAETQAMVAKIISYDSMTPTNRVALISDIGDTYSFDGVTAQLKGVLPAGTQVQEISRGQLGDGPTRAKVLEEINRAHRIINYVGHGSVQMWRGDMLTVDDAPSLLKSNELSLYVMMTCLNGYFVSPLGDSLGESLLRSPGGAVAAWASSGTTTPEGQQAMNVAAFQQLFGGQNVTIGEAARAAKAGVAEADIRRTWNLLGDPTMRLR